MAEFGNKFSFKWVRPIADDFESGNETKQTSNNLIPDDDNESDLGSIVRLKMDDFEL